MTKIDNPTTFILSDCLIRACLRKRLPCFRILQLGYCLYLFEISFLMERILVASSDKNLESSATPSEHFSGMMSVVVIKSRSIALLIRESTSLS